MPFFTPTPVDELLDKVCREPGVRLTGRPGTDAYLKRTREEILRDLNAEPAAKEKRR